MKIAFLGTPDFAVHSLRELTESKHEVVLVATQPDRPKGRGMKVQPSPVKCFASERYIPIVQPEELPDASLQKALNKTQPDALVVVAYGLKIPLELLNWQPYGVINVHGSILPKYRGAAPMQRAIMNGDCEIGVTTMLMNEGWDTGDILLKEVTVLDAEDNFGIVHDRLAKLGAKLLVRTLDGLLDGTIIPIRQDDSLASIAPKIRDADRWLDWSRTAWELHNQIRALSPVPGAITTCKQCKFRIWQSKWLRWEGELISAPYGSIISEEKGVGLWIQTGDQPLLITELQAEGGKRMPVHAYLAGHNLEKDTIWGK
jgi:methionyl-tRNA formyltransferase